MYVELMKNTLEINYVKKKVKILRDKSKDRKRNILHRHF